MKKITKINNKALATGSVPFNLLKILVKGIFTPIGLFLALQGIASKAAVRPFTVYAALRRMRMKGLVQCQKKKGKQYYTITPKGKAIFSFTLAKQNEFLEKYIKRKWDKKWRMVVFDIPESKRAKRRLLRFILISLGFKKLQKSVWITPYPVLRETKNFLKDHRLSRYIYLIEINHIDSKHKPLVLFKDYFKKQKL